MILIIIDDGVQSVRFRKPFFFPHVGTIFSEMSFVEGSHYHCLFLKTLLIVIWQRRVIHKLITNITNSCSQIRRHISGWRRISEESRVFVPAACAVTQSGLRRKTWCHLIEFNHLKVLPVNVLDRRLMQTITCVNQRPRPWREMRFLNYGCKRTTRLEMLTCGQEVIGSVPRRAEWMKREYHSDVIQRREE